jgi:sulfide:quinone oxidoreductase
MAKVVVIGAGISGHTTALTLRKLLNKKHEVVVVSPNGNYQWVPSNIWVGIGQMTRDQVIFPLEPVYKKQGIGFIQAAAKNFYPEGSANSEKPLIKVVLKKARKKLSITIS